MSAAILAAQPCPVLPAASPGCFPGRPIPYSHFYHWSPAPHSMGPLSQVHCRPEQLAYSPGDDTCLASGHRPIRLRQALRQHPSHSSFRQHQSFQQDQLFRSNLSIPSHRLDEPPSFFLLAPQPFQPRQQSFQLPSHPHRSSSPHRSSPPHQPSRPLRHYSPRLQRQHSTRLLLHLRPQLSHPPFRQRG